MAECKASKSPFLSGIKLHEFGNSPMVDITLYRKLVGSLLYLTDTRPDLSYVVSVVARHMHQPHELHWKAAKIILQYVQGTKKFGVHYTVGSSLQLAEFSDSDWADDPIDRKSTSGFVFMFAEGPICWSIKNQHLSHVLFQLFSISLFSLACFVKHFDGEIVLAPISNLRSNLSQ